MLFFILQSVVDVQKVDNLSFIPIMPQSLVEIGRLSLYFRREQ